MFLGNGRQLDTWTSGDSDDLDFFVNSDDPCDDLSEESDELETDEEQNEQADGDDSNSAPNLNGCLLPAHACLYWEGRNDCHCR